MAVFSALLAFLVAEASLRSSAEWSGWSVVASVLILLLYGIRKRVSTLPLGRVAHWLQLHIYLGLFCIFVFLMHIDWSLPTGWFEIALATSFVGTVFSGLLGLYWTRTLPTQLTRLGDEVIYDRITGFVSNLRAEAEQTVLEAVEVSGSSALADFYQRTAYNYFVAPNFQWPRLYRDYFENQKVNRALAVSKRFMATEELPFADRLDEIIKQKNLLDAHYTWQGVLRYWLIIHLAFSLALVPLICLHVVLAYNFALS